MNTLDIINWNNLFKLDWDSHCRHEFKELESFWDEKAEDFNKSIFTSVSEKYTRTIVNYIKAKSKLKASDTFLDLGCGTGILSIPIAKIVKKITVCDISLQMLNFLKERVERQKIDNINIIHKRWTNVKTPKDIQPHDIVVSHRSLGVISCADDGIPDLKSSIEKMNQIARKSVFIIPPAYELPDDRNFYTLFREFTYDNPEGNAGIANQAGLSTYILVHLMGLFPHVDYIQLKDTRKFDSIDEAVKKYSKFFNFDKGKLDKYFKSRFANKKEPYVVRVKRRIKIIWWTKTI